MSDDLTVPCPHCDTYPDPGIGEVHRPDCPIMTEPYAITRELAERGPFLSRNPYGDEWDTSCADCEATNRTSSDDLNEPTNHEPSCLWRRARKLHP